MLHKSGPSLPPCGYRDSPGSQEASSPAHLSFSVPHTVWTRGGLSFWCAWQTLASSLPSQVSIFVQVSRRLVSLTRTTRKDLILRDKWGKWGGGEVEVGTILYLTRYQIPVSHSLLLTSLWNFTQLFNYYLNRQLPIIYQNAVSGGIIFLKIKMTPLFSFCLPLKVDACLLF